MDKWTSEELERVIEEVSHRATVDPAFRELALKDPKAAIAKVSAKPLPTNAHLQFIDNSGPVKIVPLPPPVEGVELSEAEMESVAGGFGGTISAGLKITFPDS